MSLQPSTAAATPPPLCRVETGLLGAATVSRLLDYATRRQADFQAARTYDRITTQASVQPDSRSCWRLTDLDEFAEPIRKAVADRCEAAASALGLLETRLEPRELEICAYEDGGRFRRHIDTLNKGPTRVLTCVYYFSTTPRAFKGGQLRLYPLPGPPGGAPRGEPVDIDCACDTLVMFPAMTPHEVLPVEKQDAAWRTNRFNITTWACRPSSGR